MNSVLIVDIETDNLLEHVTKIHCIVTINCETKVVHRYHEDPNLPRSGDLLDGVVTLGQADLLIGHNLLGYDLPVLKKFYPGFKYKAIHDTFILSQLFFPNEMQRHGLEAWGKVFDLPKPGHEDWTILSQEMLDRCVVDTQITFKLWRNCRREIDSHDWARAIELEYRLYDIYSRHMTYWYMDLDRLAEAQTTLAEEIESTTKRLEQFTPTHVVQVAENVPLRTSKGVLTSRAMKYVGDDISHHVGPFSVVRFERLNLNSSIQVVEWLLSLGWTPDTFNYKLDKNGKPIKHEGKPIQTGPSLQGSEFKGVPNEIRECLVRRNELRHRMAVITGWANSVYDKEGRVAKIKTFALTCACPSGRFKHRGVVNVPKIEVFFGKEMRGLFIAPPGYALVGCDASQIEARVEGHYVYKYDQGEYARFLLEEDVHQRNADSWGLTRQEAKSPYYALNYACGPQKIADLLGCSLSKGKEIHSKYWEDRPSLTQLVKDLERSVVSRGQAKVKNGRTTLDLSSRPWIKGLDGRKHYVRSTHSMKNTLIQGAATVAFKQWIVIAAPLLEEIDARIVMMYHDSITVLIPDDADLKVRVLDILLKTCTMAGEAFMLKIPLVAEGNAGYNWSEVK